MALYAMAFEQVCRMSSWCSIIQSELQTCMPHKLD
jgi:hypothetical protein